MKRRVRFVARTASYDTTQELDTYDSHWTHVEVDEVARFCG